MGNVTNLKRAREMMRMKVYQGDAAAGAITVDCLNESGAPTSYPLAPRLDLARDVSAGFSWGSAGPSSDRTALAILADALANDELALKHRERFKRDVVARIGRDTTLMLDDEVVRDIVNRWELEGAGVTFANRQYSLESLLSAPPGHMPLAGTDVELVAYQNGEDLCVLVNKGPKCCYRALLKGVMRPGFKTADTGPLCDSFVIREIPGAHS